VEKDGTSKKALRREVQRTNLYRNFKWDRDTGALQGASDSLSNGEGLACEVRTGGKFCETFFEGKNTGEASREASREDWSVDDRKRPFKKIQRDGTTEEKRKWVRDHKKEFGSVSKACRTVNLSPSSYYYKLKVDPKDRAIRDADLRGLIEEIQSTMPQYGVRQVYSELLWGYKKRVNKKRIHRVMREYGLRAQIYRGFRISTTDSNHSSRIYPNLLHGKEVNGPNQVWVADITYVRIATCFVYVAAVLDLFERKIVGWAVSKRINSELCLEALKMAIEERSPDEGIIHHADRGVQYSSDVYTEDLKEN